MSLKNVVTALEGGGIGNGSIIILRREDKLIKRTVKGESAKVIRTMPSDQQSLALYATSGQPRLPHRGGRKLLAGEGHLQR